MVIRVPFWLLRLFFGRQLRDLEQRSQLTGSVSRTHGADVPGGRVEATLTVEKRP